MCSHLDGSSLRLWKPSRKAFVALWAPQMDPSSSLHVRRAPGGLRMRKPFGDGCVAKSEGQGPEGALLLTDMVTQTVRGCQVCLLGSKQLSVSNAPTLPEVTIRGARVEW